MGIRASITNQQLELEQYSRQPATNEQLLDLGATLLYTQLRLSNVFIPGEGGVLHRNSGGGGVSRRGETLTLCRETKM